MKHGCRLTKCKWCTKEQACTKYKVVVASRIDYRELEKRSSLAFLAFGVGPICEMREIWRKANPVSAPTRRSRHAHAQCRFLCTPCGTATSLTQAFLILLCHKCPNWVIPTRMLGKGKLELGIPAAHAASVQVWAALCFVHAL